MPQKGAGFSTPAICSNSWKSLWEGMAQCKRCDGAQSTAAGGFDGLHFL